MNRLEPEIVTWPNGSQQAAMSSDPLGLWVEYYEVAHLLKRIRELATIPDIDAIDKLISDFHDVGKDYYDEMDD